MADFLIAVAKVLVHEGGYEPPGTADPGGETNFGISKAAYPDVDVKALTRDGAIRIYHRDFWQPLYDQIQAQPVGNVLLDFGVNDGTTTAVRAMQEALGKLEAGPIVADGKFGPQTLEAINAVQDPLVLVRHFTVLRLAHYRTRPTADLYFNSWAERSLDW